MRGLADFELQQQLVMDLRYPESAGDAHVLGGREDDGRRVHGWVQELTYPICHASAVDLGGVVDFHVEVYDCAQGLQWVGDERLRTTEFTRVFDQLGCLEHVESYSRVEAVGLDVVQIPGQLEQGACGGRDLRDDGREGSRRVLGVETTDTGTRLEQFAGSQGVTLT